MKPGKWQIAPQSHPFAHEHILFFCISDPACKESSSVSLNSLVSLHCICSGIQGRYFWFTYWWIDFFFGGGGKVMCSALVHWGYIFHPFCCYVTDVLINISLLGWPNAHMHQNLPVCSNHRLRKLSWLFVENSLPSRILYFCVKELRKVANFGEIRLHFFCTILNITSMHSLA